MKENSVVFRLTTVHFQFIYYNWFSTGSVNFYNFLNLNLNQN